MLLRITRFRFRRRITTERRRRSEDVQFLGIHFPCNLPQVPGLTGLPLDRRRLHPVAIHPALVPVPVPAQVGPEAEIPYGDSWTWLRVGF